MSAVVRPAFYRQMAIALSLFVIIGFSRTYYLRFLTDLPPLDTLVHLHSVVFSAWLLVFIAQTRLVAAHRVDLHMKLGIAAVALAVVVVAISFATTAVKATIPRIHPSGLTPPQFTIVGIMSLVLFAGVPGARRRVPAARRVSQAFHGAGDDRRAVASRVADRHAARTARALDVPRAHRFRRCSWRACLAYDWRKQRIVHPVYAIGGAALIASWPLRVMIGRSEWYQPIGEWIARVGASL